MERLLDFVTGKLSRRMMLSSLIPLIFICYFGTLVMTVFVFPHHYDWDDDTRHRPLRDAKLLLN